MPFFFFFLLMAWVRGSASHQNGSCHLTDEQCPSSNQEVEVCVLEAVECVVSWQVSGGPRVVWLQLPRSSQAAVAAQSTDR